MKFLFEEERSIEVFILEHRLGLHSGASNDHKLLCR